MMWRRVVERQRRGEGDAGRAAQLLPQLERGERAEAEVGEAGVRVERFGIAVAEHGRRVAQDEREQIAESLAFAEGTQRIDQRQSSAATVSVLSFASSACSSAAMAYSGAIGETPCSRKSACNEASFARPSPAHAPQATEVPGKPRARRCSISASR